MTNYTRNEVLALKDDLPAGQTEKKILGADLDAELIEIEAASATKIDKPAAPNNGDHLIYNSASGDWEATAASSATAAVPVGTILDWAGSSSIPTGFLLCDGREVAKLSYPDLDTVLGGVYDQNDLLGAPAAGNFRVPDLRGLVCCGLNNMSVLMGDADRLADTNVAWADGDGDSHGDIGGEDTSSTVPAHTHTIGALPIVGSINIVHAVNDTTGGHVETGSGTSNGGFHLRSVGSGIGRDGPLSDIISATESLTLQSGNSTDSTGGTPSRVQPIMVLFKIIRALP